MSPRLSIFRYVIFAFTSCASFTIALANGLGYIWTGAWLKSAGIALTAIYLPAFFAVAWLLIPFKGAISIALLWSMAGIAIGICIFGRLSPDNFPLEVMPADFAIVFSLPISAHIYRTFK